jgi:hypothetical protein
MSLTRVYVQKRDGDFASEEDYAAWLAFSARGIPVAPYTWDDLAAGRLELTPETLVVGSVRCVEEALRQLRVTPPVPLDLPTSLATYRGRTVWESDFGTLHRDLVADRCGPVFIKPRDDAKAFVGHVVRTEADLKPTMRFPAGMRLLVSEVVDFVSEWRFYVLRGTVVGVGHYAGDPLQFPDADTIRTAVRDFADAPVAYGLDFGLAGGKTLLVEANDAYSIGLYGLSPPLYADMLEARWRELVSAQPVGVTSPAASASR